MEMIPGVIAYFIGAYVCCATRVFVWKIVNHWAKIWVADGNQAESQILSLTVLVTALIVIGIGILIWSLANYVNYKFTEKGIAANGAAGFAIALAISQDAWLNEIAGKFTYAS